MTHPDFGPEWSASRARVPEGTLREWLAFALDACDTADEIALRHFRRDLEVEAKPDRSLVTMPTRRSSAPCASGSPRYPDHGLVGEEYGTEEGDASTRWYLDPIDGTHNFCGASRCSGR